MALRLGLYFKEKIKNQKSILLHAFATFPLVVRFILLEKWKIKIIAIGQEFCHQTVV
jgi:hypothetical protein